MIRRKTREVSIGNIIIGGQNPIAVQSMINADPHDAQAVIGQLKVLKEAGCAIARMAVPDMSAVPVIAKAKAAVDMPLVADIHFDYRLAVEAARAGVDKIRINPGNIGGADRVEAVVKECRERNIPIRIGVNGGSLEKDLLQRFGGPTPEAMIESAARHVDLLTQFDFENIVLSLKASDVPTMVEAYRLASQRWDFPLHLGVTEAGTLHMGIIKSAAGLGALLCEGIGDTIRVSLTAPPVEEINAGYDILRALGLHSKGIELISCPTCGRCKVDLISIANEVEKRISGIETPLKIAVMGCAVNGPGEARQADLGIACGDGVGLLFRKGEIIKKVPQSEIVEALYREILEYR